MRFCFLLFLLVFSANAFSQTDGKVYWVPDGLSWTDFKASPESNSKFHANTNAGLSFSWGVKNDNGEIALSYDVISYFNPNLSWVKMGPDSDYLLKHEQLHFDITELHARKLRKKLAEVNPRILISDPKGVLTRIYQAVEKERTGMQLKFDKESRHSLDKEGEARWRKYVKAELLRYEEVSS